MSEIETAQEALDVAAADLRKAKAALAKKQSAANSAKKAEAGRAVRDARQAFIETRDSLGLSPNNYPAKARQ